MPKKKKNERMVELDDDDLLNDPGLENDKAELDLNGIPEQFKLQDEEEFAKDDIFDEDIIPDEKEITQQKQPEEVSGPLEEPVLQEEDKKLSLFFFKLKKLPLIKIFVVFGGTIGCFFIGWFAMSYFLFAPSTQNDFDKNDMEKLNQFDTYGEPEKIYQVKATLELDPFIIPLQDPKRGTSFLRITIHMRLGEITEEDAQKETKKIRSTIYNLLSQKKAQDILNDKKREKLKAEIENNINHVLKQTVVEDIKLKDVLLV